MIRCLKSPAREFVRCLQRRNVFVHDSQGCARFTRLPWALMFVAFGD